MYLPLINESLTEHATIMTAAVEAKRHKDETCQPYTAFTCAQQLPKILVDIKWVVMLGFLILNCQFSKFIFLLNIELY